MALLSEDFGFDFEKNKLVFRMTPPNLKFKNLVREEQWFEEDSYKTETFCTFYDIS